MIPRQSHPVRSDTSEALPNAMADSEPPLLQLLRDTLQSCFYIFFTVVITSATVAVLFGLDRLIVWMLSWR